MTEMNRLNAETLEMVAGGKVVKETGQCLTDVKNPVHEHNYKHMGEELITPPGGTDYCRDHFKCVDCGEEYFTEWAAVEY